ncbi:MAG TPA: HEPN domain-containing protein [Spirochaetota bacterium]|nr:HEPN domain-containing protein [Spirochaetota bacterium]HOM09530.1 HEPN domain-containing protein [Spirochaetota bacterium]HPP49543.1 HEPN domain-containing protein [Spirochaetota bacterium]
MEKKDIVKYWKETSDRDYETMLHLFQSKDFHWSLFIGHLVIEKLLKAIFVINNDHNIVPPKTHDLLLLAKKAGIETNDEINDMLDFITTFNINCTIS